MAIAGSSDNQNQQLRDIIRSLESLNGSIKDTFDVQKNLLEAFSESNSSATKNLASIKDTMERQQKAISAYISAMRSSGVVSTAGPQVDATAALMSSSKLKTNAAADAETAKVMDIIKEHTKQMIESAKNAETSNEKMDKLIGVLEKHTLSNETLKKFIEDVKNGKKFTSEALYGKEVEGLSKAERSRLDASTSKLVNSIAESNKIASLEYDEREKRDDLDRLQKESDTALLEIRDALLSGKVEVKEKTEKVRSKYVTNAELERMKKGSDKNGDVIGDALKAKLIWDFTKSYGKTILSSLLTVMKLTAYSLPFALTTSAFKMGFDQFDSNKKLTELIEEAKKEGISSSDLIKILKQNGTINPKTYEGKKAEEFIKKAYNENPTVANVVSSSTGALEGMGGQLVGWVQGLFGIKPGDKKSILNADGSLKPVETPSEEAITSAAGATAIGSMPIGVELARKLVSNKSVHKGIDLMFKYGKRSDWYAKLMTKYGSSLFKTGTFLEKYASPLSKVLGRASAITSIIELYYYGYKTIEANWSLYDDLYKAYDDAEKIAEHYERRYGSIERTLPEETRKLLDSYSLKKKSGIDPSEKERLARFKVDIMKKFIMLCQNAISLYKNHFAHVNTASIDPKLKLYQPKALGQMAGSMFGFRQIAAHHSIKSTSDFQNSVYKLIEVFCKEIVDAEDEESIVKTYNEYVKKLEKIVSEAYEKQGPTGTYKEDVTDIVPVGTMSGFGDPYGMTSAMPERVIRYHAGSPINQEIYDKYHEAINRIRNQLYSLPSFTPNVNNVPDLVRDFMLPWKDSDMFGRWGLFNYNMQRKDDGKNVQYKQNIIRVDQKNISSDNTGKVVRTELNQRAVGR